MHRNFKWIYIIFKKSKENELIYVCVKLFISSRLSYLLTYLLTYSTYLTYLTYSTYLTYLT
jgi:hypothetical protein